MLLGAVIARAEDATDFFEKQCVSCHTIGGGPLTGPDLKNVTERKDRAWLENFIVNPQAVLASGDPYAIELQKAARGAVMPTIPNLNKANAKVLLDFIVEESAKEKSKYGGSQVSDRPFLATDISAGHDFFSGRRPFAGGAPACITCHDVSSLKFFGGGRLGPQLTNAFATLGGRSALASWLSSPPSPTMQPIYKEYPLEADEIFALVAFLQSESTSKAPTTDGNLLGFVFMGVLGTGGILALLDTVWRGRNLGVREALVKSANRKTPGGGEGEMHS